MTPSGKWLPKIAMVHNPYQHGLGQGTKPQQHSNQWSLIPHMPVQPKVVCTFLPGLQHRRTGSLRAPWLQEFQLPSEVSRYPPGLIPGNLSPHFSLQGSNLLQGNPRRSVHTPRSTGDPQGKICCLQSTSSPSYSL
jgi:hypothetical protein